MRSITRRRLVGWWIVTACGVVSAGPAAWGEAKVELLLPLERTAYQTNEPIHLAVVRGGPDALRAGDLTLTVTGRDGSRMTFALAVPAVAKVGDDARATEHVVLNGRLLRPGHYTVEASVDGATGSTDIDVFSHARRSSFRLINWGRAKGSDQLAEGEDALGFNLFYGHYAGDEQANFIRAGVDFMRCCTMGGGHQMDLRGECDWSDPYVSRGGAVRMVRQALAERTRPNVPGVHFYDEPGLTHLTHPVTGERTPHGIPSQLRSYRSAFDRDALSYHKVDPDNPDHAAQWRHWARWKLSFMDAAWKLAQWSVSYVRPDFLSVTQSQYGFTAFTDGYYFNVARCLPVVSGHGGYHDYGLMLYNPAYTLEMARARDLAKPCWYLPTWYGNTTSEQFRLEQYMSFQTGIQGLITPPDIDPFRPGKTLAAEGVVESNKLAARLGTVFTTMPPTRPPVAVLYSLSHLIHVQTRDRTMNYAHQDAHVETLSYLYLAGKMIQQPLLAVVDEDVLDGTLAASHKAVILPSVDYLDAPVVTALEDFIADGGLVLLAGKCKVKVSGAVDLGVVPALPEQELYDKLRKEGKDKEARALETLGRKLQGARSLAEAVKARLAKAGIASVFECDNPGISATRQAAGDVEYLFALNAATDWDGPDNNTQAAAASISLPDDGRSVYDAVRGGAVGELRKADGRLAGRFRFGPGQMRVFARTARPIGSVKVSTPIVAREYTQEAQPLCVEIGAAVVDADGQPLCGSVPLRVRLIDPLGQVRYDLYRATRLGMLRTELQLGANDAPGEWTVAVRELLGDSEGRAAFRVAAPPRCGALAGRKERAVHFGRDRDNIFRFFRVHRNVTLVAGKSDYNAAAAKRLTDILAPWDVKCTTVSAAEVNKPRQVPAEAVATWIGLEPGRVDKTKGADVPRAGFAVEGAVILLGTPEDNPLIAYLLKQKFLPYKPVKGTFPGRGRGFLAWQRDGVGHEQESITLIAHDAEGMSEAVGTMYEAMAGIEPLTALATPRASRVIAASRPETLAEPKVAWEAILPDRAVAMKVDGDRLIVLTRDESLSTVDRQGKASAPQPLDADGFAAKAAEMKPQADPAAVKAAEASPVAGRIVKHVAARDGMVAVGYWGGLIRVLAGDGTVKAAHQFQHDVTGIAWLGDVLVVGLSEGTVVGVTLK